VLVIAIVTCALGLGRPAPSKLKFPVGDSVTPEGGAVVVLGPTTVTSCQPRGVIGLTLDAEGRIASVDVAGDTSPQLCSDGGLVPPQE